MSVELDEFHVISTVPSRSGLLNTVRLVGGSGLVLSTSIAVTVSVPKLTSFKSYATTVILYRSSSTKFLVCHVTVHPSAIVVSLVFPKLPSTV